MNFYLESAKAADYQELMQFADFQGVITTPSMFSSENLDVKTAIDEMLEVMPDSQSLFIPVIQSGFRSMLKEARDLAALSPKIIPVVPFSAEGLMVLKACFTLKVKAACSKISRPEQLVFALSNRAPILLISQRLMKKAGSSKKMAKTLQAMRSENSDDALKDVQVIFYDVQDAADAGDLLSQAEKWISLKPQTVKEILDDQVLKSEIQEEKDDWIMNYTRMEFFE